MPCVVVYYDESAVGIIIGMKIKKKSYNHCGLVRLMTRYLQVVFALEPESHVKLGWFVFDVTPSGRNIKSIDIFEWSLNTIFD